MTWVSNVTYNIYTYIISILWVHVNQPCYNFHHSTLMLILPYILSLATNTALLQSLLPGVNITSGNTASNMQPVGVGGLNSAQWNSDDKKASSQQQQDSNIW